MRICISLFVVTAFHLMNSELGACSFDKAKLVKEVVLKDGVLKLGTLQKTAKNQDPIVAFYSGGREVFCRSDYDESPIDARAVAATADKDHLYVIFSADGGASASFSRFTKRGWQKSYGQGGGAKILALLKLRKSDGTPVSGTYLGARKADGKTNSVALKGLVFENNSVKVTAEAWYSPLRIDGTPYRCKGPSPFQYSVVFAPDLGTAISADAPQCE